VLEPEYLHEIYGLFGDGLRMLTEEDTPWHLTSETFAWDQTKKIKPHVIHQHLEAKAKEEKRRHTGEKTPSHPVRA
jgi:hypothetical protein